MEASMSVPGVPSPGKMPPRSSAYMIESFEGELNRLDEEITMLEDRLAPVLTNQDGDENAYPEEAPQHELHRGVIRLGRLNRRLTSIMGRIQL